MKQGWMVIDEVASEMGLSVLTTRMYIRWVLKGPTKKEWRWFQTKGGRRRAEVGLYSPSDVRKLLAAVKGT